MGRFELEKIVRWYFVLALFVLLILKGIMVYFVDSFDYENPKDEMYEMYISKLEGPIDSTKERAVITEWQKMCNTVSVEDAMAEKYMSGEINRDEYAQYNDDLMYASGHLDSVEKVMEDYRYIKQIYKKTHSRVKPHFINARYWNYYFNAWNVEWFPILLIIVVSVFCVSVEQSSGMWNIINSAYNGKAKLVTIKMFVAGISGMVISLAFSLVEYIIYLKLLGLSSMNAPIQSLHMFKNIDMVVSIKTVVVMLILWRALMGAVVSCISVLVSLLIKRDIVALVVVLAVVFSPVLISNIFPNVFARSICGMYNGVSVVLLSVGTNPTAFISGCFLIVLSGIFLYILNLIRLGYLKRYFN